MRLQRNGIIASVVETGSARHLFTTGVPRVGGDFQAQAEEVLSDLKSLSEGTGKGYEIVRLTLFLKEGANRIRCRQIVDEVMGDMPPITVCVTQPPCGGHEVVLEAWGVEKSEAVKISRLNTGLVVVRHDDTTWAHFGEVAKKEAAGTAYDQVFNAFIQLREMIEAAGFSFENVIRTWLYQGDILGAEGIGLRYDGLNRARSDFFKGISFGKGLPFPEQSGTMYPGSTGIGTDDKDLVMSCIAFRTAREDDLIVPLENSLQTSAFQYGKAYTPSSPKFCCGIAHITPETTLIFVSGTASILQSDTMHAGDVTAQTEQTIENIASLISHENLAAHRLSGAGASLSDIVYFRVYVKNRGDYSRVRAACEDRLGDLPAVYAVADICRTDLLVEIECTVVADRRADHSD